MLSLLPVTVAAQLPALKMPLSWGMDVIYQLCFVLVVSNFTSIVLIVFLLVL